MARSTLTNVAAPGASTRSAPASGHRLLLTSLVISLRPSQWTKNLLVFAALIFAVRLFDLAAVVAASEAFVIFCALSGVVYLVNDVMDRESDRRHPLKSRRPIAAGDVSVPAALTTAAVIGGAALTAAFAVGWRFGAVATAYVALQGLYSGPLKHIVIIDVLT